MNPHKLDPPETTDQDQFWSLYEQRARAPIARACERVSKQLSGGRIDVDEMISWIDLKVWKLARRGGWPLFQDEPTPEDAIDRVLERANLLARWAYLAHVRGYWRRKKHEGACAEQADRVQRLAGVHGEPAPFEHREDVRLKLQAIRDSLDEDLRGKLAASWIDESDRRRIAAGIGATRDTDNDLIAKTTEGDMKRNTVEQMRSRTLRTAREALANSARPLVILLAVGVFVLTSSNVFAKGGDQTGGRKGATVTQPEQP